VKAPELGLAFVDPAFRCPGLTKRLAETAFQLARDNGDVGVFDCSVTTHTHSQKAMQEYFGSRPCSLFLGIAAEGMQAKELATTRQEKGSVMNHYYAFDRSGKTVYVTPRINAWAGHLRWWSCPGSSAARPGAAPGPSSGCGSPAEDAELASWCSRLGQNTSPRWPRLHHCRTQRMHAGVRLLPKGMAGPRPCGTVRAHGFFFAGIMHHIHGGDDRSFSNK
jgi:hypothetical protein